MKTILYDKHVALGAKIVEFAGWNMPVHYSSIIQEHLAVRQRVGLFDVSHMGRIVIHGQEAEEFLDYISTNKIAEKHDLSATYTVFCRPTGKSIDDAIIYRQDERTFFTIVNAGNRQKDLEHIKEQARAFHVTIEERYKDDGILAVQGPLARQVLIKLFPGISTIKPMTFATLTYQSTDIIVSGTGYTGAGGYEIYAPLQLIPSLWDEIMAAGQSEGIRPIGLGARDTLRLEMGFALYGHELSEEIAPTESVSAWTVKWDKIEFIGKPALEKLELNPAKRHQYGVLLLDKGVAREGYTVLKHSKEIGRVTSGTLSPTLNQSIAIIMTDVELQLDDYVLIQIRQNLCQGKVVKLPFIKKA